MRVGPNTTAEELARQLLADAALPPHLTLDVSDARHEWLGSDTSGALTIGAGAAAAPLDAVLAQGPVGGWCVSCAEEGAPPRAMLRFGFVTQGPSGQCKLCVNFTSAALGVLGLARPTHA